jgi:hypothetical protein
MKIMKRVRFASDVGEDGLIHPADQFSVTWAAEQQRWVQVIADIIAEKAVALVAEAASFIEGRDKQMRAAQTELDRLHELADAPADQIDAARGQIRDLRYEPKAYKNWVCAVQVLPSILVPFDAMPTHDVQEAKDANKTIDFTMGCDTWTAFARGHRRFCYDVIKMVVSDLVDNRITANPLIKASIVGAVMKLDPHVAAFQFQLSIEPREDPTEGLVAVLCTQIYRSDIGAIAEARNI